MFKLIIVDDEEVALHGLAEYVDWNAMNFKLAGTARTIEEALTLIQQQQVEAVLTDIHLEEESGLDLVGRLSQAYPRIKCVILSGYGEFEYARQALRYGAFDFLTKPVQMEALQRTFCNLARRLQKDSQADGMQKEYLELKRTCFFNNLAKEKQFSFDPEEAKELGIRQEGTLYLARILLEEDCLAIALQDGAKGKLLQTIQRVFENKISCDVFNNTLNEYAVLFYQCRQEPVDESLCELVQELEEEVSIGVSLPFEALADLPEAYFEAGKALDYRLLRRDSGIVFYSTIQGVIYKDHIILEETQMNLNDALARKDMDAFRQMTVHEIESVNRGNDSLNYLYSFCIELHLLVDRFLRNFLPGYVGRELTDSIRQVVLRDSKDAIMEYMDQYIQSISASVERASPYVSDTVQSIQKYIHEHYAEDITLKTLTNQFFLHPNYLSKLFNEKTGENFIEYLTKVRFENAKKLLEETNLKIYDISQMVGYKSPKYFSRIFKEIYGMTPKEFREEVL